MWDCLLSPCLRNQPCGHNVPCKRPLEVLYIVTPQYCARIYSDSHITQVGTASCLPVSEIRPVVTTAPVSALCKCCEMTPHDCDALSIGRYTDGKHHAEHHTRHKHSTVR